MTTVIYDCDTDDLSQQSMTRLANMYHESEYTTEWQPGEDLPEKLIITSISKEIADQLDIAEEDLVHIDEAMELLQSDISHSDIITQGQAELKEEDYFTPLQCIQLAIMTIDDNLRSEKIPEHEKADLRCINKILDATKRCIEHIGRAEEDGEEDRQRRCASSIRAMRNELITVCNEIIAGDYHAPRSQQEPTT